MGGVGVSTRGGDAEQIEGAVLCAGGGGEDGSEAITPEADDIAGEGREIAQRRMEAAHREWFAPAFARAGVAGSVRLRTR